MKTVHKFTLKTEDFQLIEMSRGARILCVEVQFGRVCIWAEVDTELSLLDRKIHTVSTGGPMPVVPLRYIGTYQLSGGSLIYHVYEERP